MRAAAIIVFAVSMTGFGLAVAQPTPPAPTGPVPDTACTPDTRETSPTEGSGNRRQPGGNPSDLSDRLADSKGVLCPPKVDDDIQLRPPAGGDIKTVPAPGTPGGSPNVEPK